MACFCTPPTVKEASLQSDIIFLGEIIEKFDQNSRLFNSFEQTDSVYRISFANFKVLKVHRYWQAETPHVISVIDETPYIRGKLFYQEGTDIGDTLLVYANFVRPLSLMKTRDCSRTANISFLEKEDLELLENEALWKKPEELSEKKLNKFQKIISHTPKETVANSFRLINAFWIILFISILGNLFLIFKRS